jgi:hypothetical protein
VYGEEGNFPLLRAFARCNGKEYTFSRWWNCLVYGEEGNFPLIRAFVGCNGEEYGFFRWIETTRPLPVGQRHLTSMFRETAKIWKNFYRKVESNLWFAVKKVFILTSLL